MARMRRSRMMKATPAMATAATNSLSFQILTSSGPASVGERGLIMEISGRRGLIKSQMSGGRGLKNRNMRQERVKTQMSGGRGFN